MSEYGVSRRNIVCGFVAAGAAVPLIAACGSGTDSGSGPGAGAGSDAGADPGSSATTGSDGAIQTSEIPVGGGKIFPDRDILVTQPTAGEFKAFSASCTHQGTQLNRISGDVAICPNHGSQFSLADGAVEQGPASQPLPEKKVTLTGDSLIVSG